MGLFLPAAVHAEFSYPTNGGAVYYTITNGAITITSWASAVGYTNACIPATISNLPVTSIADDAFYDSTYMIGVSIPNTVTNIGNNAFFQTFLFSVAIPDSVISIGTNAFYWCNYMTNASIGNGVTSIGDGAFALCESLTRVTLGTNLISIGNDVFANCLDLNNVTIPNKVANIGNEAFVATSQTRITIPQSVTNIGIDVFGTCGNLTAINVDPNNPAYSSIGGVLFNKSQTTLIAFPESSASYYPNYTIPNSVTKIESWAFYSCSLYDVTMFGSVTDIGDHAFNDCYNLTNVIIPASVTNIGDSAFSGCYDLTAITVNPNNPAYSSVNGVLFNKRQTTLIQYPGGLAGNYTIPNSVVSIGDNAFAVNFSLTNVTIGNGVASIGASAFEYCNNLMNVYFTGNAPSVDSTAFYLDTATAYYLPGTTGWTVFAKNSGLQTALWFLPNPAILTFEPNFGVHTNRFGFTISWDTNISVAVDACTNLAKPAWTPIATNTLTGGAAYFSDPQWTNYPGRFYRLRSP